MPPTPKLTYAQLRAILALVVSNDTMRLKLSDLFSGQGAAFTEIELIELIVQSEVDKDLIRIISGRDPDSMDALEGLEYISAFFSYMRANNEKLTAWLANTGLLPKAKPQATPSKSSK